MIFDTAINIFNDKYICNNSKNKKNDIKISHKTPLEYG